MKKNIDGIIVVEGKSDVSFLSSFIKSEFVITNGSAISKLTLDYLKEQSLKKQIYVLTDPDYQGNKIRKTLNDQIPNLINCYIHLKKIEDNKKTGVAECSKESILKALDLYFVLNKQSPKKLIEPKALFELGLFGKENSATLRNKVAQEFSLGSVNGKQLLKRLNSLNVSIEEIVSVL